jgi:hypothetical protein
MQELIHEVRKAGSDTRRVLQDGAVHRRQLPFAEPWSQTRTRVTN